MSWRLIRAASALALALAIALVPSAHAQSLQTGNITGKVSDNTGARTPGVTVTLTSPVLITARTAVTDQEGSYRFTALPPGTYALAFELKGFRKLTHSSVPVSLATTLSVDATLQVGDVSETVDVVGAPLVDVTQTNVATNLDVHMLQGIPTARDVWAILQNLAPQVVLDREDVGGSQGGLQAVFSTHGSTWHQNTYAMNGANVTDPAATGAAGFYYDYDSFEEVNISTAQHSAEVGTPGVYYNFVAKRGTDSFHGGLAYYFENSGLVSNNVTKTLKDKGIASGGGVDLFSDGTAQLGGPLIKDKLRFYTSWRDWRIHRNVPNFFKEGFFSSSGQPCVTTGTSPCTPKTENTDLRSGLVNLSYQLNANNRIDALWTRQTYWKPNRNASASVQPDSTWIEDDVFSIYQAHYNSQISSNALFDARVSFSDVSFPLFLQDGVTQPNTTELTTGNQTGAASFGYAPPQHRTRLSLNGTLSFFKGRFADADHSFKAGYEFYRGYSSSNLDALDGINLQTFNGAPATVTEYNTPVPGIDEFKGSVLFLQDSITKNRLVINAGLRFEHTNGFLPEQGKAAGPFSQAQSTPRQGVITWNNLAPRLGLVYDLFGNHKAALKAGYGRYHHQIGGDMINVPNQLGLAGTGYNWIDRNGDGRFQRGEEGDLLFTFGGNTNTVDPHLKRPRTDEITAGLDFELPHSIKLSVDSVFRWGRDLVALAEVGIPQNTTGYSQTVGIDPGNDGITGTADDRQITVFNQKPEFAGKNKRVETNPSDFRSHFKGVEVTLQRRYANRWQALLTYALSYDDLSSTSVSVGTPFGGEEEGAGGVAFGAGTIAFQDLNGKINNTSGPSFYNRRHQLKTSVGYDIPKLDVTVAAVFKVQTGTPWGRIVSLSADADGVPFNQGPISFFAEPRDSRHFDTIHYLDFRLGKFFNLKKHRLEAVLDLFNAFNANTITNLNPNTGSAISNPTDILGPRVLRLGARWTF